MSDIRHLVRIQSSLKKVYAALTTQEGLATHFDAELIRAGRGKDKMERIELVFRKEGLDILS